MIGKIKSVSKLCSQLWISKYKHTHTHNRPSTRMCVLRTVCEYIRSEIRFNQASWTRQLVLLHLLPIYLTGKSGNNAERDSLI